MQAALLQGAPASSSSSMISSSSMSRGSRGHSSSSSSSVHRPTAASLQPRSCSRRTTALRALSAGSGGGGEDSWAAASTQQHVPAGSWTGPAVDWSRYHLAVLFVDQSDQLRAKLAAALFERVTDWNGWSRVLLPTTAGIDVDATQSSWDLSVQAGLMARAHALGLAPRVFTRQPEPLELRDLDLHDVVVAVDTATRAAILQRVEPQHRQYYEEKVRLLSEYGQQAALADSDVLTAGGLALLPRRMSLALRRDLAQLRAVQDMPRPLGQQQLGGGGDGQEDAAAAQAEAEEAWDVCVRSAMLGSAGLVRFLIDSYPDDLPEYDPL